VSARPEPGQSPTPAPVGGPPGWLLGVGLLLLASPASALAWLLGAGLLRVPRLRAWWLLCAGISAGLLVAVVVGPRAALASHFWLLDQTATWYFGGGPGSRPLALPWAVGLARTVPLGVPLGLGIAGAAGMHAGPQPGGVPADAARRATRTDQRALTQGRRRAQRASIEGGKPEAAPLAVALGGDLDSWRRGRYLVMPPRAAALPRVVLGAPGGGKSVYLAREAYLAGLAGRRLIVLDGKGERGFAAAIVAAYLAGRPDANVHLFPAEPLDGWRGGDQAQVNRLMGLWPWSVEADYYREITLLALRLACGWPDPQRPDPVSSMAGLIGRLDPGDLGRRWATSRAEAALVKQLTPKLADVQVRVANLAAAVGANLDGTRALGDADLTVVSIATMALAGDAEALFRLCLADLAHWTAARKDPSPALVMVDEFSAISGGRLAAIHLLERGRSAGVPVVLAAQSRRALGTEEEAERLIGAAHALILFATSEPDDVLRLAGSTRGLDYAWQVDDRGRGLGRGTSTTRARAKVDANRVRAFEPGQAVIIAAGRAGECLIIPPPTGGRALERR
jgi:hypothetical protein